MMTLTVGVHLPLSLPREETANVTARGGGGGLELESLLAG